MKYEGVARSWADQAVCSDTGRSHFLLHQSVVFQSDDPKKKKKKKGFMVGVFFSQQDQPS